MKYGMLVCYLPCSALEFGCPVDQGKTPPVQCDWAKLQQELAGCAYEPVRRILSVSCGVVGSPGQVLWGGGAWQEQWTAAGAGQWCLWWGWGI